MIRYTVQILPRRHDVCRLDPGASYAHVCANLSPVNLGAPELLLIAMILLIFGRYVLPPVVVAFALRDTDAREREGIVRELNVFFRRGRRGHTENRPRSSLS